MSANTEMVRLDLIEAEKAQELTERQSLPATTSSDNGKFLKVYQGKWVKGSSDLPSVSADDNGKVLMVVNGAWAVASLEDDET